LRFEPSPAGRDMNGWNRVAEPSRARRRFRDESTSWEPRREPPEWKQWTRFNSVDQDRPLNPTEMLRELTPWTLSSEIRKQQVRTPCPGPVERPDYAAIVRWM
jgi:hypothetical protein